VALQQLLLPYPQYTSLNVMNSTSGNSIYHSLQMKVEKRMARGSGFLLSYTTGKLISDTRKSAALFGSYNQNVPVQNWDDLRSERSISEMDVAQTLSFSYVLSLPVGTGRALWGGASGVAAGAEDASVLMAERCLELSLHTVERSALAQIGAGAKAFLLCEPAANKVYISPRQMRAGSGVFERFVMEPNRRLAALMAGRGADLIFHDCGELTTDMVQRFATDLQPSILSLGSSRKLWEDAAVVPKEVVLFGNLPTKTFYSDSVMPVEEVVRQSSELCAQMSACGHPHILGSECDVLCVPGAEATIRRKVMAMLKAG
jgi:hypothetical protein